MLFLQLYFYFQVSHFDQWVKDGGLLLPRVKTEAKISGMWAPPSCAGHMGQVVTSEWSQLIPDLSRQSQPLVAGCSIGHEPRPLHVSGWEMVSVNLGHFFHTDVSCDWQLRLTPDWSTSWSRLHRLSRLQAMPLVQDGGFLFSHVWIVGENLY